MKNLIKMIEWAKVQRELLMVETNSALNYKLPTELFWGLIEQASPIVFSESIDDREFSGSYQAEELLDSPFSTYSIELLSSNPLCEKISTLNTGPSDPSPTCILVHEKIDSKGTVSNIIIAYSEWENEAGRRLRYISGSSVFGSVVKAYLAKLNKQEVGTEHCRSRLKIGIGKLKRFHNIKRIVHVRPKSKRSDLADYTKRDIDWTHRWLVRGHWRIAKGLGKDRTGAYCVSGRTWVTAHDKGPEDAPLIKKTRLIKENLK